MEGLLYQRTVTVRAVAVISESDCFKSELEPEKNKALG